MNGTRTSIGTGEYEAALEAARWGKNLFLLLLALAVLEQLTAAGLVVFGGVLDAPAAPADGQAGAAEAWEPALDLLLSLNKYVAPVLAGLLAVSLLLALNVVLVGRLGGGAGLIGAFLWAVILLALLVPWQNVFGTRNAMGALYGLDELRAWAWPLRPAWWPEGAAEIPLVEKVAAAARVFGYPVLVLLVLIVLQVKFARSCREIPGPEVALPRRPSPADYPTPTPQPPAGQ
jgi:hypothetical protein